ncbi:MAG: ABC transporter permease, partial [Acidobacteriota bacterium]
MRKGVFVRRSLVYYWRTHLAVVAGVATSVGVLAGALLVGESVRASLRDLFLRRLGNADLVVSASSFFRERLADDLQAQDGFSAGFQGACPLIALEGVVTHAQSGRRASQVQVYGVDERFWRFHGTGAVALGGRDVFLTDPLAREVGSSPGDSILLRLEKSSAVPGGSLHGQKEDVGRTMRLSVREGLSGSGFKEFALYPHQGDVRAVFVPLERLQRDLDQEGRVNAILVSEKDPRDAIGLMEGLLRQAVTLEDLGVKLGALEDAHSLSVESESILIDRRLAEAARGAAGRLGLESASIFTYLANAIRAGETEIPYSLVSALDPGSFGALSSTAYGEERSLYLPPSAFQEPILLNDWAAWDLGVRAGDYV